MHNDTCKYVEELLSYNFIPISVLPTRITNKSTTLIDHIYYFEGKNNMNQNIKAFTGNILTDITDHFSNYLILYNRNNTDPERPLIRNYNKTNK